MKFEENLRELRKQNGFSQEELADRLHVSRQAVSKWENGSGYPELDKLMMLCELFRCSMDTLLKGDVTELNVVDIDRYEKYYKSMSISTTFGVFMCISAATIWTLFDPQFNQNKTLGTAIFFIFVTIGVLTFIYFGMQYESFRKKNPKMPKNIYSTMEIEAFENTFRIAMVVGVGIILLSLIVQQVMESKIPEHYANGIFMFMVSIAVCIFVYFGTQNTKYEETQPKSKNSKDNQMIGKVCSVIMMISTAIFLLWGFLWKGWSIAWIVFVIGGILCGIASVIIHKEES